MTEEQDISDQINRPVQLHEEPPPQASGEGLPGNLDYLENRTIGGPNQPMECNHTIEIHGEPGVVSVGMSIDAETHQFADVCEQSQSVEQPILSYTEFREPFLGESADTPSAEQTTVRTEQNGVPPTIELHECHNQQSTYFPEQSTQPSDDYIEPEQNSNIDRDPLLVETRVLELRTKQESRLFFSWPVFSPIIFDNTVSEARDLCASERNFLSWLKLSLALALAGGVLFVDLRIPSDGGMPTIISNQSWSQTLGIVLFVLALLSLFANLANYIHAVAGYAKMKSRVTMRRLAQVLLIVTACVILAINIAILSNGFNNADTTPSKIATRARA
jgi:uncharacterized membrane protein YidH (DUF202 family)